MCFESATTVSGNNRVVVILPNKISPEQTNYHQVIKLQSSNCTVHHTGVYLDTFGASFTRGWLAGGTGRFGGCLSHHKLSHNRSGNSSLPLFRRNRIFLNCPSLCGQLSHLLRHPPTLSFSTRKMVNFAFFCGQTKTMTIS